MTTIKLKLENEIDILKEQKTFNNIVRLSFNRYQDRFKEKEIRSYLKEKFPETYIWWKVQLKTISQETYFKRKI